MINNSARLGRSFGLQAEVPFFRAFGSIDGGLETTATIRLLNRGRASSRNGTMAREIGG